MRILPDMTYRDGHNSEPVELKELIRQCCKALDDVDSRLDETLKSNDEHSTSEGSMGNGRELELTSEHDDEGHVPRTPS